MGRHMAAEELRAIPITTSVSWFGAAAMAMGINKLAAAVLLIKLLDKIVSTIKKAAMIQGE